MDKQSARPSEGSAEFVDLARSVYRTNDARCAVKRAIDHLVGSRFVEVKSYNDGNGSRAFRTIVQRLLLLLLLVDKGRMSTYLRGSRVSASKQL